MTNGGTTGRTDQNVCETKMQLPRFRPSAQVMPGIWKHVCREINHYEVVCRRGWNKKMHSIDQETDQYQKESDTDVDNINSINFNSKLSLITANLKTSSNQAIIVIAYQVDMGSDGNIMPLHIYKTYSLGLQKNN